MLNKEDKDGIIEFLKERLRIIRDAAEGLETRIYYDITNSTIENIVELCDHALMDVSF